MMYGNWAQFQTFSVEGDRRLGAWKKRCEKQEKRGKRDSQSAGNREKVKKFTTFHFILLKKRDKEDRTTMERVEKREKKVREAGVRGTGSRRFRIPLSHTTSVQSS